MSKSIPYESETALSALGQRITEARKRRGWRQADVAAKVGLSRTTVQKVEAGDPGTGIGAYMQLLALYGATSSMNQVCLVDDDLGYLDHSTTKQRVRPPKSLDNDF
ncbi:helix-turn-helix domain-containing protein [Neptuniibacter halophilus]|uniref:helix-turn-helix domain-containing protein n=1 Tax=Neptuniibacter halophilus TaxID=651666 RepID=UPI002572921D|nr:helix-turn-helix domain-containing protein [Neptuniibacter halophilus]